MRGLAVIATSREDIDSIAMVASGGAIGIAGVVTFTEVEDITEAYIAHSNVNSPGDYGEQVIVRAFQSTDLSTFAIGVTGGAVALAGTVDNTSVANHTRAFIDRDASGSDPSIGASTIYANGVEVSARTRENLFVFVLSGGGGVVAITGAVAVGDDSSTTDAYIRGSDVFSHAGIAVRAENTVRLRPNTGSVAGGFVGAAGSVYVGSVTNATKAQLLGAHLNAIGATSVIAIKETVSPFVGTASRRRRRPRRRRAGDDDRDDRGGERQVRRRPQHADQPGGDLPARHERAGRQHRGARRRDAGRDRGCDRRRPRRDRRLRPRRRRPQQDRRRDLSRHARLRGGDITILADSHRTIRPPSRAPAACSASAARSP